MRILITAILICGAIFASAQETSTFPKNEIKTNLLNDLFRIVTLNYERLLNEESGIGLNLAVIAIEDSDANLTISPYYRLYFGNKPAAGFYVEGTGTFITYKSSIIDGDDGITGGIGLAAGTKLLTKKGWVFEVFGGLTRVFLDSDIFGNDGGSGFAYPRLGLSIGKRF